MKGELIIKFKKSETAPIELDKHTSAAVLYPIIDLLEVENIALRPLFPNISENQPNPTELSGYYIVEAPDERLEFLKSKFLEQNTIVAAYIKPPAEPPGFIEAPETTSSTPDFSYRQGYLNAAPIGINARYSWTFPGGSGLNVNIIDIEGAWRFDHEDLQNKQGGLISGQQSLELSWRNHGTAVLGEFSGDQNSFGILGICPDAKVRAISIFGNSSSSAIVLAANELQAGDIILIELHRPGPRYQYQSRSDQRGFIPIEWWPDDFDAIQYATTRSIIVVEAGGNGAENLDHQIYNQRPSGFPEYWTNPFNRNNRDSGAILVGAGAPPQGTHGRDHGPARSRLPFSNYGDIMDSQGWGREVTTTGYGDLQRGADENKWYTDTFSGTSSASPIVVGAIGCIQGVLHAHNLQMLTPTLARSLLRNTGSTQQDAPGRPSSERIGSLPDLKQLIAHSLSR